MSHEPKPEMSQDPKPEYDTPSVEEVDTEDSPAVTAPGVDSPISDLRLKRSLRPLEETILRAENNDEREYEAPSVEEVNTEDTPAVTAAGADSNLSSDLRLKRSLRQLEETILRRSQE